MDTTALREKSQEELATEITELQKQHFKLRLQKASQSLGNTAELGNTRRAIARAKTILAEKRRTEAK